MRPPSYNLDKIVYISDDIFQGGQRLRASFRETIGHTVVATDRIGQVAIEFVKKNSEKIEIWAIVGIFWRWIERKLCHFHCPSLTWLLNTGRSKAEGQFPREGERLQPEMQLPQKVEQLNIQQTTSKLHTNIIFNAYSFFQIQKRATPPGKVSFEYLPLKIYVIVAKSPDLQRCPRVNLSNKTTKCICAISGKF